MTLAELEGAVIANPRADRPRQAFAEAIAPDFPERAQLIHTELAVLKARRAGDVGRVPGEERLVALRARVFPRLSAALGDLVPPGRRIGIGRGFIEAVFAPASWLLANAARLFQCTPLLDVHVTLLDVPLEALLAASWLERLRSLGLAQCGLGDAQAAQIATANLSQLRALDLSCNRMGLAGFDSLANSLPRLRFVQLAGNLAEDPNYRTVFADDHVSGPRPTSASSAFLARHPGCAWLGHHSADEPPLAGLLHDEEGH